MGTTHQVSKQHHAKSQKIDDKFALLALAGQGDMRETGCSTEGRVNQQA